LSNHLDVYEIGTIEPEGFVSLLFFVDRKEKHFIVLFFCFSFVVRKKNNLFFLTLFFSILFCSILFCSILINAVLNTKFPIISNPCKEFPIEKYTNPNAPYRGLTLMYSPMSGSAGEKTADIIDVSSDENEDDLENEMEYDEDEMYAGDKNGPVFREGYVSVK